MARFGRNARSAFGKEATEGLFGTPSRDIRGAVDAIGRRELAERMSGTTDHSSREYKNARDYISRHLRGARTSIKSDKFGGAIEGANREGRKRDIIERGTLNVTINADVKISEKTWKNGHIKATLSGKALDDYVRDIEAGRLGDAAQIAANSYGINRGVTLSTIKGVHYS